MSNDIENPMLFDKNRELNETHEVKAIGRCEACKTFIYSDDTYLKTDFEDILCNADCLEQHLIEDKYIEKIYGDK